MTTMKSIDKAQGASAPRWTYISAALIGILGLAWTIVSHFIPKNEVAKPIAQPTVQQIATASGENSKAVNAEGTAKVFIRDKASASQELSSDASQSGIDPNLSPPAKPGGVAVNAAGASRVLLNRP